MTTSEIDSAIALANSLSHLRIDELLEELKCNCSQIDWNYIGNPSSLRDLLEKLLALKNIILKHDEWGCGQNPGHLNEVIYGIYSPTNYCSIKTV